MTPAVVLELVAAVIMVCMIHTIRSAHWLVVAMMARLSPPVIEGTTMASERRPKSGNWYMKDCSVPALRKSGTKDEKPRMRTRSRIARPKWPPGSPDRSLVMRSASLPFAP